MKTKLLLILLCSFLLVACDGFLSRYHGDSYNYKMPASHKGQKCVTMCDKIKQQCIDLTHSHQGTCGERAAVIQKQRRIADVVNKNEGNRYGHIAPMEDCKKQFKKDKRMCVTQYNTCYERCGGIIEVEK